MAHRLRVEPTRCFSGYKVWLDDFELSGVREVQLEISAGVPPVGIISFVFNDATVDIENITLKGAQDV